MKVLLVDDHLMFRLGIRSVIEQQSDVTVVGEAASYLEAISMIESTEPDVTVLDLRMPGAGGLAVLGEAKKRGFTTKFLILSSYASEEEIYQAIRYFKRFETCTMAVATYHSRFKHSSKAGSRCEI